MFKIVLRPNLKYPIYLIIWALLRKITSILISIIFNFKGTIIYTFLMFFGELAVGLLFCVYLKRFSFKKIWNIILSKIAILSKKSSMKSVDGNLKISFLVFITAFYDFFEFIISTYYLSKIHEISGTLQTRLGGVSIIVSSLLCCYLLKIQIFNHHIFSLIIIGVCIILLILSEYLFNMYDEILKINELTLALFLSILSHISVVLLNVTEKYLIDIDFINPFLLLSFQGIIGLILTIICMCYENPFPALKLVYNNNSTEKFIFFVFLLIIYSIFGALKNIYKLFTISLFSPVNKSLADIIINPLYIIYYFSVGVDFLNNR